MLANSAFKFTCKERVKDARKKREFLLERTFSSSSASGSAIVSKDRPAIRSTGGHSRGAELSSDIPAGVRKMFLNQSALSEQQFTRVYDTTLYDHG